jgi:lipopolysaccharide/colanic/teichoic acid biosynthesis glycosyltransferase
MIRVFKLYFPQAALLLLPGRPVVKPGLTGRAQVRYPCGAPIGASRQTLRYDLCYARNCSPFLDLLIMLGRLRVVLWQEGPR